MTQNIRQPTALVGDLDHDVLASLKDHIAVLDRNGTIISVNGAWGRFCDENGSPPWTAIGPGVNYLDLCRRASKDSDELSRKALAGITAVLNGSTEEFMLEYPCHSPSTPRWFLMSVTSLKRRDGGAVVSHTDITARRQAEEALRRAHSVLEARIKERAASLEAVNAQLEAGIIERKRTEQELHRANARLQQLVSGSPAVIYSCRASGDYEATFVSENISSMLGYEARQFTEDPRFWIDRIHPEDAPRVIAELPRLFEQGWQGHEYRFKHKDGTYRWLRDELALLRDEAGNTGEIIGYMADITERKQAEQERQHLAEVLEATTDFVGMADKEGRALYVNRAGRKLVGFPEDFDVRTTTIPDYHTAEAGAKVLNEAVPTAKREGVWAGESVLLRRDGREIPVSQVLLAHRAPDGTVQVLSTIMRDLTEQKRAEEELRRAHDELEVRVEERTASLAVANTRLELEITERRQKEKALRESEAKYRTLVEQIPAVTFIAALDAASTTVYVSPQVQQLLGFSQSEWKEDPDLWRKQLHPEDRERVLAEVVHHQASGEPLITEYRMFSRDGRLLWIREDSLVGRDDSGKPLFFQGVMLDVTERRGAEETLRETNERFRLLLETTNAIPWEADAGTWQFTYVGPQAVKLLNYPVRQWYEKDFWAAHIHPEDRQWAIDFCESSSRKLADYEFEYRMIAADGRIVWFHDLVTVVSANGVPTLLRGFMIDITERKRAEEALRELNGRLINAQEEERSRIARELHDDVNQRLALLAVELDLLGQTPPHSDAETNIHARNLSAQVKALSSDVHRLSYRLHPSKIEQLGLVAAMKSLCRELSLKHDFPVEFIDRDVQRVIPKDIAICLYRILQEALRNVVKHSGAREAWAELVGSPTAIHLRISDSGRGFNPNSVKGKGGLGLVGMQERVHPLGGEIAIDSQPAQGTRINVRIPLPPSPS